MKIPVLLFNFSYLLEIIPTVGGDVKIKKSKKYITVVSQHITHLAMGCVDSFVLSQGLKEWNCVLSSCNVTSCTVELVKQQTLPELPDLLPVIFSAYCAMNESPQILFVVSS